MLCACIKKRRASEAPSAVSADDLHPERMSRLDRSNQHPSPANYSRARRRGGPSRHRRKIKKRSPWGAILISTRSRLVQGALRWTEVVGELLVAVDVTSI